VAGALAAFLGVAITAAIPRRRSAVAGEPEPEVAEVV